MDVIMNVLMVIIAITYRVLSPRDGGQAISSRVTHTKIPGILG